MRARSVNPESVRRRRRVECCEFKVHARRWGDTLYKRAKQLVRYVVGMGDAIKWLSHILPACVRWIGRGRFKSICGFV